jgi:D-beta-D-heptose 7-phosphate kinase/D-beta-D-heptose 1-phosphate adenosyltransferase
MKTVCVFGDVMLDTWVHCSPTKISSEAPVLICTREKETYSPGGAANVAANIKCGFGLDVELIGVLSGDNVGCTLIECLNTHSIGHKLMVEAGYWVTIEKRRFVDGLGRQMLRLDTEGRLDQHAKLSHTAQVHLRDSLDVACERADTLVISDYGKGTCTPELIEYALKQFRTRGKYTIVNGKPDKLPCYRGADLLIYNLSEAAAAWTQFGNQSWNGTDVASLAGMLYNFMHQPLFRDYGKTPLETGPDILITCGDQGMELWKADGPWRQEAVPVKVADVAGAGDTVVATIATYGRCDKEVLGVAAMCASEVVSQHGTSICKSTLHEYGLPPERT